MIPTQPQEPNKSPDQTPADQNELDKQIKNKDESSASSSGVVPTPQQTQERIRKLAIVGTALSDTFSEENQDYGTDFALAKTSLQSFIEDIEAMELPEPSKQGIRDLVTYLNKKIDKRINASVKGEDHFD